MPSRRAILRGGSLGLSAALAGCTGSLLGSSMGDASVAVAPDAFATDPKLADVVDVPRENVERSTGNIRFYDLERLGQYPRTMSTLQGDRVPFALGIESGDATWIERVSNAVTATHTVYTPDGPAQLRGFAADGEFTADDYLQDAVVTGDSSASYRGFDLYLAGDVPHVGIRDGAVVGTRGDLARSEVGDSDGSDGTALEKRLLEEYVDRARDEPGPAGWLQNGLDRVRPAHHVHLAYGTQPGDRRIRIASIEGVEVLDDSEAVYRYAFAAATPEAFEELWDPSATSARVEHDAQVAPTVETGATAGHARVTVPASRLPELLS